MKNIQIIISLFFLIISSFIVSADPEQYLYPGVDRAGLYQQGGHGVWDGRTGVPYTRPGNYYYQTPFVQNIYDVDDDDQNEIVIMTTTPSVQILNFTKGVGVLLEAEHNLEGAISNNGRAFYQTPALIDYDDDNVTEIVYVHQTPGTGLNASIISWNETSITVEHNYQISTDTSSWTGTIITPYPSVICAPGSMMMSGNDTCGILIQDSDQYSSLIVFQPSNGKYTRHNITNMTSGYQVAKSSLLRVVDIDSDGYGEFVTNYRLTSGTPSSNNIFVFDVLVNNTVSSRCLYRHKLSGGLSSTFIGNIIVSNLDGTLTNGMEVSWPWSDGTNWYARTVDNDGNVKESQYETVLSAPEGTARSNLAAASNTEFCDYTNDVYYMVHDNANNVTVIECISLYNGVGTKQTVYDDSTAWVNPTIIHDVDLYNTGSGILTPYYGIKDGEKQDLHPSLLGRDEIIVPVDYEISGTLDLIGINNTRIIYYDDAYNNQNAELISIDVDTGNPVCEDELIKVTAGFTDNESDYVNCYMQETYANHTVIQNYTIIGSNSPGSLSFNHLADMTGTFLLKIYCKDQYHTVYDSYTYTLTVSNDTQTCNPVGQNPFSDEQQSQEELQAQAEFDDAVDELSCGLFHMCSRTAKGIFWLIIMIVVLGAAIVALGKAGVSGVGIIGSTSGLGVILVLLGWLLGFLTAVPVVIMGLFMALVITISWVTMGKGGQG